jgi:hypothetical protein
VFACCVGRHQRRPPVPARIAHAAHNTWATARAEKVFPSDEKHRSGNEAARIAGHSFSGRRQATLQQMVMFYRTNPQRTSFE